MQIVELKEWMECEMIDKGESRKKTYIEDFSYTTKKLPLAT